VKARQIMGGIMLAFGGAAGLLLLWGTRACEVNIAGATLAAALAVIGGLVFDSDTFVRAIRAWRGTGAP
jgi:hypothetical protein